MVLSGEALMNLLASCVYRSGRWETQVRGYALKTPLGRLDSSLSVWLDEIRYCFACCIV